MGLVVAPTNPVQLCQNLRRFTGKERIPEPPKTVNFFGGRSEWGTQQSRSSPHHVDIKTNTNTTTTKHSPFPFWLAITCYASTNQRLCGESVVNPLSPIVKCLGEDVTHSPVLFPYCTITNCYIFIVTNLYTNYINPYIYIYIYMNRLCFVIILTLLQCYMCNSYKCNFDTVAIRKLVLYAMA